MNLKKANINFSLIKQGDEPIELCLTDTRSMVEAMLLRGALKVYDIITDATSDKSHIIKAFTGLTSYSKYIDERINFGDGSKKDSAIEVDL